MLINSRLVRASWMSSIAGGTMLTVLVWLMLAEYLTALKLPLLFVYTDHFSVPTVLTKALGVLALCALGIGVLVLIWESMAKFTPKNLCLCTEPLDEHLRCEACEDISKTTEIVKVKECKNCGKVYDSKESTRGHECSQ